MNAGISLQFWVKLMKKSAVSPLVMAELFLFRYTRCQTILRKELAETVFYYIECSPIRKEWWFLPQI